MDTEKQAKYLIEGGNDLGPKVKVLCNRMMLQIASETSLLSTWVDYSANQGADGCAKIQFGFMRLPDEIIPLLRKLLSTDFFDASRVVSYVKNGQAMTGLEISVREDDLPGDAHDYAF